MTELMNVNIETSLDLISTTVEMDTITPAVMARISERMVEIDRANKTTGRKNTQTTNQLMTLNMISSSPYRRLRQCLAQIEDRRRAIESYYWGWRKSEVEAKKWEEEWEEDGNELSLIELEQHKYDRERGKIYIEGAIKELSVFQEAYEEIRINNNIPENWSEEDAELDEIKHHIRQAFTQSHRDMTLNGSISQGNAEYLQQYGVHLQTAKNFIGKYIATCEKMLEEGLVPTINHYYEFLDGVVEVFGEEYKKVLNHIGVDNLIRQELLFKSTREFS